MKKLFLPLLLVGIQTYAQDDTSYMYFDKFGMEISKDKADSYSKIYRSEVLWKKQDYGIKTDSLYRKTTFLDKGLKIRHGIAKDYYRNGELLDSMFYDNNKRKEVWYFYEGGKKQSHAAYDNGRVSEQTGWDEAGNELKDFVVEKGAQFPGGMEGWKMYLERNLNANVASNDRAPLGVYTVKVQFIIDKNGYVSNVKAISVPTLCPSCGGESERIISRGPRWSPAIQNGKPVIYQALQYVSFQVAR